jgi:histidinol-phosphatase (PHP family)
MEEIGFADHAPAEGGYDPAWRMDLRDFPSYAQMVKQLQDQGAPRVLFGIEADYYEGCESFLRIWLPRQKFDYVVGSIHYLGPWGFDNPANLDRWRTADIRAVWRDYFAIVQRMAATGLYDILGHFDVPKKFGHRLDDRTLKELAAPALDAIAGAQMGIEINTSGLRRPIAEQYPSLFLLGLMHDREIPICFGSDAHRPGDVGAGFATALAVARQAGYTAYARYRQRRRSLVPLVSAA